MTLTIEIDDNVKGSLEQKATQARMALSDFVASILSREADIHNTPKVQRNLGFGEGRGYWMSDDFDAPLDEFKDYM